MGWSRGSVLMTEIIASAKKHIPNDAAREDFYRQIIRAFMDNDADTLEECIRKDEAYKRALRGEGYYSWQSGSNE